MNMNRFKLGAAGCALAVLGFASTFLYFAHQKEAVNTVSAGQVDLAIVEPEVADGYEEKLEGLMPGQILDKSPAVVLDKGSVDAYIRVKIEYKGALAEQEGETEEEKAARLRKLRELEAGIDFSEGWLKGQDGFYYYQKAVGPGSSTPFFTQLTIPKTWGNEIAKQAFSMDLAAEGIPADYFDPWSEDEHGNAVITGWCYTDGTPVE